MLLEKSMHKAEQKILSIRLVQLCEEENIKQSEMNNFSQTSVSKVEKCRDMETFTLIDYLDNLRMGLEILTYS